MLDALMIANALIAVVALLRLRPSLFIIVANQTITLRSLSTMEKYGQPTRQYYLPASLYTPQNFAIAGKIFLIATVIAAVSALWTERAHAPQPMVALPKTLQRMLGLYFLAFIVSSKTILSGGYTDPARVVFNLNLSGIHALLAGLAVYEVFRRVYDRSIEPRTGLAFVFLLFFASDYVKGGTGFPSGALTCAVLLFSRYIAAAWRRYGLVLALMAGVIALALVVRGVREALHAEPGHAFQSFANGLAHTEEEREQTGEGVESEGNGSQYAAHVLECINLYEAGVNREWRSIYAPIEYTFKPSALVSAFGLTRSKEAAWELAEYYIHGGGIYVLGELYWNGGYLCVSLVFAFIMWWATRCDIRSRYSFFWGCCVCLFDVGLLQGFGYGFAQVSRGMLNGLVAVLFLRIVARIAKATATTSSAAVARPI